MFRFFRHSKKEVAEDPQPGKADLPTTSTADVAESSAGLADGQQASTTSGAPVQSEFSSAHPATAETVTATSWRDRLRNAGLTRNLAQLFIRNPRLDDHLLDEIETVLLTADVGVTVTTTLIERLSSQIKARAFADVQALWSALRSELLQVLTPIAHPLKIPFSPHPFVLLVVGINGTGKTTSIGKLALYLKQEGHRVLLAAGDTFRAAAVSQLQTWGQRNDVAVIAQGQDADAASVAFDALQAAKARQASVLIIDTAGRLHTQSGLMNELSKIARVLAKVDTSAPHEVLMVIDGTTGQNALSQLRLFLAAVRVSGLIVTKLDGSAKGGVVFALAREFSIPIRYIGVGEKLTDLRPFDPHAFIDAILPEHVPPHANG